MSWFSKAIGADGKREQKQRAAEINKYGMAGGPQAMYGKAIQQYADPTQGQEQLGALIRAQVEGAMPSLFKALQGTKENAIQRGISTGDLGTSYEGDVFSSFQRNIANAIAPQTFDLYQGNRNTFLDLISGQIDRDDTNRNAAKNRSAALWGAGINAVGQIGGGVVDKASSLFKGG